MHQELFALVKFASCSEKQPRAGFTKSFPTASTWAARVCVYVCVGESRDACMKGGACSPLPRKCISVALCRSAKLKGFSLPEDPPPQLWRWCMGTAPQALTWDCAQFSKSERQEPEMLKSAVYVWQPGENEAIPLCEGASRRATVGSSDESVPSSKNAVFSALLDVSTYCWSKDVRDNVYLHDSSPPVWPRCSHPEPS